MKRRLLKLVFMLVFANVVLQVPRTAFAGGAALLPAAIGLDALLFSFGGCGNAAANDPATNP